MPRVTSGYNSWCEKNIKTKTWIIIVYTKKTGFLVDRCWNYTLNFLPSSFERTLSWNEWKIILRKNKFKDIIIYKTITTSSGERALITHVGRVVPWKLIRISWKTNECRLQRGVRVRPRLGRTAGRHDKLDGWLTVQPVREPTPLFRLFCNLLA